MLRYAGMNPKGKNFPEEAVQSAIEEALALAEPKGIWQVIPYSPSEGRIEGNPPLVLTGRPEFGTGKGSVPGKSLATVITVLRTRQNAEGGFGLWSASVEPNEFASVYATQLLIEAKERGILPDDAATFNSAQDAITWLHNNHG
mgnify:CR=1 FL=1